jgi:excisionase family DNA binding protein
MPGKTPKKPYHRTRPNNKQKARTARTLTISEVIRLTGFGRAAVYQLVRSGELPALRVGVKYYVLRSVLERWLEERGNAA